MYDQDTSERSRSPASGREKVADVADTARHEMGTVADEVRSQTGRVASDMRGQITDQARVRQQQVADRIRQTGDELRAMAADREESPARTAVEALAGRSAQMADYLSNHGPDELLADVQDFARRRPAAFLLSAALAGFVVGRVTKGVLAERSSASAAGNGSPGDGSTYRSAAEPPSAATTAVDQVPAVGVAPAPGPGPTYTAGVAPVPASVAPPATAPPATAPPATAPPANAVPPNAVPATGGEQR